MSKSLRLGLLDCDKRLQRSWCYRASPCQQLYSFIAIHQQSNDPRKQDYFRC